MENTQDPVFSKELRKSSPRGTINWNGENCSAVRVIFIQTGQALLPSPHKWFKRHQKGAYGGQAAGNRCKQGAWEKFLGL